jgi:hypothetical protein
LCLAQSQDETLSDDDALDNNNSDVVIDEETPKTSTVSRGSKISCYLARVDGQLYGKCENAHDGKNFFHAFISRYRRN